MNNSKYIVGKWYKGFSSPDEVAVKYLTHNEEYFYWTESIRKSSGHMIYNEGNWYHEPNLIECFIKEIQQYLPENHPDRVNYIAKSIVDDFSYQEPLKKLLQDL